MTAPWEKLHRSLSAAEAIAVGRQGPRLNAQGERVLRYLRERNRRREAFLDWAADQWAISNGLTVVMPCGTIVNGGDR